MAVVPTIKQVHLTGDNLYGHLALSDHNVTLYLSSINIKSGKEILGNYLTKAELEGLIEELVEVRDIMEEQEAQRLTTLGKAKECKHLPLA